MSYDIFIYVLNCYKKRTRDCVQRANESLVLSVFFTSAVFVFALSSDDPIAPAQSGVLYVYKILTE